MKILVGLGVIVGAVLLIGAMCASSLAGSYNGFVDKETTVENSWADVEVQYQRRADLIPMMEAIVQGVADQERELFTEVARLRSQGDSLKNASADPTSAQSMEEFNQTQSYVDNVILQVRALVENYPQMRSNEAFLKFQDEVAGTENRIAVARRDYNEKVGDYRRATKSFPGNLIAGFFGFDQDQFKFFRAEEGADKAPEIDFDIGDN